MTRLTLGLLGFGTHPWASVERTKQFWKSALAEEFQVTQAGPSGWPDSPVDAAVSFSDRRCWELERHPDYPIVVAMHGSLVIGQRFLREHATRLETRDVLVVNCTSDLSILETTFQAGAAPRTCLLPLPVDGAVFRPRDRLACRVDLELDGCDFVVGFVARLLPQKNLHRYLRLLAELRTRLAPKKVGGLVIGDYWSDYPVLDYGCADYYKYVPGLIAELGIAHDVTYFPARLSDDELATCYAAMDLLIHPTNSLDENFGYAPVEAMACGVATLGAAYGGLKDTIQHGETGFLMPTWVTPSGIRTDVIEGMEFLLRFFSDDSLRDRMSRACLERAHTHYTRAACGRLLCEAVRQACSPSQGRPSVPLALTPEPPAFPGAGLLPDVAHPWERYAPFVQHYVSSPVPEITPARRVQTAAPVELIDRGRVRLQDPAWPAAFPVDSVTRTLLARCHVTAQEAGAVATTHEEWKALREAVESGLLVCSVPD